MRLVTKPPRASAVTPEIKEVYDVTRKAPRLHSVLTVSVVFVLALVPAALADRGGGNGGGGKGKGSGGTTAPSTPSNTTASSSTTSGCAQSAPAVVVENTWAWSATGAWGMPGQRLGYEFQVINYDSGCSSATFAVSVSAPSGFSVSIPTNTISLGSGGIGYLWAYVTSPSGAADGDYPLTVSVTRTSAPNDGGSTPTWYKVYSSDSAAPTLYWPNPDNGMLISGKSYGVVVSSADDHAVKKIDFYLDGAYRSTTNCADISSVCQLYYKWSLRGVHGSHTATFESWDWMGNTAELKTTFSVK
jgi:hypothetical protein